MLKKNEKDTDKILTLDAEYDALGDRPLNLVPSENLAPVTSPSSHSCTVQPEPFTLFLSWGPKPVGSEGPGNCLAHLLVYPQGQHRGGAPSVG